ncbi:hypothetical protein VHEMI05711 [[Torrubiella] hemipterigena]|uniref:GPR1/FUN34/YaaH-class plasma membrane protein n=1 Tax=[Torrubiella] hemipterigena TaxID=1531966 RepID=A0A0A1THB1_9HYPO|nr:hypothetical protein VHEMI05711 [[Torrubiella] hemipterigena]
MAHAENNNMADEALNGKDYNSEDRMETLNRFRSAQSISMSPEMFEKLYLSPQNAVKGELRKTFANPTPIAIAGFVLSLTPLSCDLMGWRGAGGNGAASIPVYFFQGGILMIVGGLFEFFLGNTFPCVVFLTFGTFWLSFAGTLNSSFEAYALYAPPGEAAAVGITTPGFNASFAFWLLFMGLLCVIYLIAALRTNIAFVIVFACLVVAFPLLTGAYFLQAMDYAGNAAVVLKLVKAAGAMAFICSLTGWWIFFALILAAVDFPLNIPVGDLSGMIRGASERNRA